MDYPCRNALSLHVAVTHIMKEYGAISWSPAPKALAAQRVDVVFFSDAIHRQGPIRLLYVYLLFIMFETYHHYFPTNLYAFCTSRRRQQLLLSAATSPSFQYLAQNSLVQISPQILLK